MAITDWPENQRPRERLIKGGPQHLSDAELLAIFLRTGSKGVNAVDLARHLMSHFGSLGRLFAAELNDFKELKGIGPAKFAQLCRCFLAAYFKSIFSIISATCGDHLRNLPCRGYNFRLPAVNLLRNPSA